jgi:molecular chaperone DnaK (HSP70)
MKFSLPKKGFLICFLVFALIGCKAMQADKNEGSSAQSVLSETICLEVEMECFPMIKKGSILPTSFSTTFSNRDSSQTTVGLNLYQGDNNLVNQNRLVGEFVLPIESSSRGKAQVQVTITIDNKKTLTIVAQDLNTKKTKEFLGGTVK